MSHQAKQWKNIDRWNPRPFPGHKISGKWIFRFQCVSNCEPADRDSSSQSFAKTITFEEVEFDEQDEKENESNAIMEILI